MKCCFEKIAGLLLILLLAGCGGSGDEYQGFNPSVSLNTPNNYLTYFNRQAQLSAGAYTLVVATATANQSGSFSVMVTRNDGSASQLINGSWSDSFGPSANPETTCGVADPANRCYSIDMQDARGASFVLNTTQDGLLYLVDDSDTPQIVASANATGAGAAERMKFSRSIIDEADFTSAYYRAVDPGNQRDTAQKYLALHGLATPDVHVIFRDTKDLGYGRDMYMRSYANPPPPTGCGGQTIAFFVRNFSVKIVDGFAYGPVNLEAAINEDLQHHVGTNAIEFGLGRKDVAGDTCSTEPMAKFYTFEPDYSSPGAAHQRRLKVDLDARGAKAMPQPCITCHGGKLRPLDRNGDFVAMHANDNADQIGDTKARMQAFEVDTFQFSDKPGFRRADVEEGLRLLNAAIYCTYPGSAGHPACVPHGGGVIAQTDPGEWSGDFGREMMLGWYGGALQTPGSAFDSSFVPAGWTPSPGVTPVGADALFTKVVGPNCFVCHGKRGTELGTDLDPSSVGKDLDFSSWSKFISHADEIERLVFIEGKMPMGLLNYQNFWDDSEKAELLASFVAPHVSDSAGFAARRLDASGNVILPGRIVARAGPDRITMPNAAISLNAQASLFADGYSWQVISTPTVGAIASLSSTTKKRTDFSADIPGSYIVRLTASSSANGTAASDDVEILVDSGLGYNPRNLGFYPDISAELADCAAACHTNGFITGIPVWWTEAQPFTVPPVPMTGTPSLGFYEQVRARVNLVTIEDSLILKKPARIHHYGGQQGQNLGYNLTRGLGDFDRRNYDKFVNWIAEGAVCGAGSAVQCAQ